MPPRKRSPELESKPTNGFENVYHLAIADEYIGTADHVLLVWHDNQLVPAEQYRKAHFDDETTDAVVCENPNIQKAQIGDKAIIYHFNGNGSGGMGR